MYLNIAKHNLLNRYALWQKNNAALNVHLDYDKFYALLGKGMTVDNFAKATIYLEHEGYMKFHTDSVDKLDIEITPKGISAGLSYHFKKINDEIYHKWIIDFSMLFCNILVVIFAVIALNKSNDSEMKDVQDKLKLLQQQQVEVQLKQAKTETQLQLFESKNVEKKGVVDSLQ